MVAVWGLPPSLLLAIIGHVVPHGSPCHPIARPCACKLKTAVVPVAGIAQWRGAMEGGIIESSNITRSWTYLGTAAAFPHPAADPAADLPSGSWHRAALASVQALTWAPGLAKLTARASDIAALRGSFGIRAAEWNMYAAPLVT